MKNRLISIVFAVFACTFLLIGCNNGDDGTGDSSNNNPVSPVAQTGTLQGRVSIPLDNTRLSSSLSSDSAVIASVSKNIENDSAIRAVQNFYGTKVWLEDLPDIFSYTDEQGNYTIANVPFGQHRVVANLKVGSNEYKWRSDKQNVLDTKIVVVPQIVMIPANTSISGFIYDSVTKQPVQGVIVEVWGQKSTSSFDGSYTVYNMPTGSWDVTYTKTGYNTMTTPISFVEGSSSSGNFYLVPSNGGSSCG